MPKERELQVDDVEPPGAQDPVQGPLQRWHRDPQPLEAAGRDQGPELQQPLGEAFPAVGVGDQHHLAAVGLHGPAALLGVELVVDQHHRRQIVASRQLGHQPMHPRLGAKARRAGRHLGHVEDTEAFWAHRARRDNRSSSRLPGDDAGASVDQAHGRRWLNDADHFGSVLVSTVRSSAIRDRR